MHSSSPERCVQGERMQAHNINYNNKNYCNIVSCMNYGIIIIK